ncbi:hypothetical protein CYPRO_0373 [Cyclonatronum proteinivorum]|uniref:Glycosyl hydrolase family 76 n=1 Tax=Cyclonatronum proteinivorum TaxID=1457365 RepID=A0A345UGQ9_9BACT|nr:hypothetical protein [Cyclonatronum proteinivorum]AXI99660.1 hypothetical protein CYPRO_0373 [Cyclonatronum proteinivorum]
MKTLNAPRLPFCGYALAAIVLMLPFFASCASEEAPEPVPGPEVLIPAAAYNDGTPYFRNDRIYLEDYSNALHAIFMTAGNSRSSELANENYRPELAEQSNPRAQQWLDLVQLTDSFFNSSGRFTPYFTRQDDGFVPAQKTDLSVYPHLVYAYHMHHRGGRFSDEAIEQALYFQPLNYLVSPGRYLLQNHYRDGAFFDDDGRIDYRSMSYALGGIHGHIYSWVIWAKPDGEDNMGMVDEARLTGWMQFTKEEMADIALEVAAYLDAAWDSERQIYVFQDDMMDAAWSIDALGAMIRGHKALYEALYMFGQGTETMFAARQLFDRSVILFEHAEALAKPWGFPQRISFTADGPVAAATYTEPYHTFQFMNHIGGGFSWDRELEGTSGFIGEHQPDIPRRVGALSDMLLQGALDHMMPEGRVVKQLSYENGSVKDQMTGISAAGMFVTAAGNIYRKGSAFERASDWESVTDDVRERSRLLYDAKIAHTAFIEQFLDGM